MLTNLKIKNARKIKLTLDLIEICSKNGNLQFHRLLSAKDFADQFLFLLKKVRISSILIRFQRRGKAGLITKKLVSKQNKLVWEQIEERILYMIQLWSDTFMMHEAKFPGFQLTYRQLRKEGVKFPDRDANERMLMSSLGVDSPMFDYVE